MKIKLLLFIFLLAIGGSMSAQLVLPICSVNLPCPGFPLGSVQAPIDQNGWRNFKVTLTQNVTSFSFVGIPPSPAQAAVNVIFTQDATGGRTVTFAAGITSSCTITSTANSTTLCQFEYDGIAGQWFSISSGGSTVSLVGPVLKATDAPFGCVGDNATVNDSCWSALQTAAAAGDFTIYFPKGTYKWATSPSFTTPVNITCEKGTFFNYTGTGNEITFGDIGTVAGTTFDFHPYRVMGCNHIGGASATNGIYGGLNHWKIEIADNLWYNWGSTTNYAILCQGNNECIIHHNKYWQDTGAATNWLNCQDAGTAGFGACAVFENDLNCVANVSGSGAPTQGVCGIGMWIRTTTGTEIVNNPFISAFTVPIRLDPASSAISVLVTGNYIEENTSQTGIQLGNPASSNQVIDSVIIDNNRFFVGNGATVVSVANGTAKITNSKFVNNFGRNGSAVAFVTFNNASGQAGNCANNNTGFASARSTAGTAEQWTDCNQSLGTGTSRTANSTSGGSASAFLAHAATAGGAYAWQSDDGAADAKTWDFIQATGSSNICFRAVNDANSAANNVFCATRGTGAAVANLSISPPILSVGTAPTLTGTGACATITTTAGGAFAGTGKCTAATAASTLTITFGATAANGYVCDVWDETTRANVFQQTSHTTTTCVLTVTSVTQNDVFVFKGIGF